MWTRGRWCQGTWSPQNWGSCWVHSCSDHSYGHQSKSCMLHITNHIHWMCLQWFCLHMNMISLQARANVGRVLTLPSWHGLQLGLCLVHSVLWDTWNSLTHFLPSKQTSILFLDYLELPREDILHPKIEPGVWLKFQVPRDAFHPQHPFLGVAQTFAMSLNFPCRTLLSQAPGTKHCKRGQSNLLRQVYRGIYSVRGFL